MWLVGVRMENNSKRLVGVCMCCVLCVNVCSGVLWVVTCVRV